MSRPSRSRRIAKRTGVGLCAAILSLCIASFFVAIRYGFPSRKPATGAYDNYVFGVSSGSIYLWKTFMTVQTGLVPDGLKIDRIGSPSLADMDWLPSSRPTQFGPMLILPLWLPLALVAFAKSVIVYRERRRRRIPPGHCAACRYDLTGNTTGVCSECGAAVPVKSTTAIQK